MLHLAQKAFWPARIPFPVMHIDTGQNFDEVIEYRDRRVADLGAQARRRLACRSRSTRAASPNRPGPRASRNRLQTTTLLDAIEEHRFDAAFGGARRDEEKAGPRNGCTASETSSGSGIPRTSGPSCGTSTTAASSPGEHIRVFPLSNWTELDIWQYIAEEACRDPVDLLRP
jgi:sulfate adenylyltransferase subunit 2